MGGSEPVHDLLLLNGDLLLTRPVFKSCYRVEVADDRHALLLHERGNRLLSGSAYVVLVELLREARSVGDLVAAALPRVSAEEVFYMLARLEQMGVLREAHEGPRSPTEGFWEALGVDPQAASQALAASTVTLQAMGDVCVQHLARSLAALGIDVADHGDLRVALVDDYLNPELATFNEECLRDRRPWMLARTSGSILWLGPILRPEATACWECMAHRLRGHRVAETYVQTKTEDSHPRMTAPYALPSTELAAAGMAATEIAKWICHAKSSQLEGCLVTVDLATLTMEHHVVVRRPQCPACGDPGMRRGLKPLLLTSRPKELRSDGGYRSGPPEATLAAYGHHVSRLTGVVRELTKVPRVDANVAPLWYSGLNIARKDDTIDSLREHFRGISGGKGRTEEQARASALCEAIERYSGVFEGDEARVKGSLEALGDDAIHPNSVMLFSDAQYARQAESSTRRSVRVPVPFDVRAEVEWSLLWSLRDERFRYLPTANCYYEYPLPPESRFCWADSNGCAAGASLEEAILQGFLELVERDCVAVWWYNRIRRPRVDLSVFDEPYFDRVQHYYRSLGRELWVLDITGDFGIPAFAAISRRIDAKTEDITLGFGAHLDPRIGVMRAVTEGNQFLPVVVPGGPSLSASEPADDEVLSWLTTATVKNQPFLAPDGESDHYEPHESNDLREDVETCVRIAAARGLDTLVLDQTRPDIGLSVVRVVVPGMRHFWSRFAPGRLYGVPVDLGWLPAPLAESDLNPIPVFF